MIHSGWLGSLVALLSLAFVACSSSGQTPGGAAGAGGAVSTGGRGGVVSSGGTTSTGGAATGGAAGTGGVNTGGAPNPGGGASGGANSIGGSSTGGASSGGKGGGGATGTGGKAGAAGTGGLDPYRRCDQSLGAQNNPGCDANTRCVLGTCASPCDDNLSLATGTGDECPPPLTGTATRMCNILNCTLHCLEDMTCPDGMTCNATSSVCLWP